MLVGMSLRLKKVACKRYGKRLARTSIYSRLWSFGVRSLRSRECGLYEASDLLLRDHLTEKSVTVQWVNVSMPQKRSCRLKDHKILQQMAEFNPDSKDIYEENLLNTHYPQRPESLEDVCLYV